MITMLISLFHKRGAQGLPLAPFPCKAKEVEKVVHSSFFCGVARLIFTVLYFHPSEAVVQIIRITDTISCPRQDAWITEESKQ